MPTFFLGFPELIFLDKTIPCIFFEHKNLNIYNMAIKALGTCLKFDEHIKAITSKVIKTIYVLQKLNNCLPWSSFTTTYKSFVRPHLD